jgi:3-oxoacyl-[acyl-carrier-protein] synthase-1
MKPLLLSAYTVVTALGRGLNPTYEALLNRDSGLRPCHFEDVEFNAYAGQVNGLETRPIGGKLAGFDCRNNRLALLALEQDGFLDAAKKASERYGSDRVAVILGTSTSGVLTTEHAYRERDLKSGTLPTSFVERCRYTHDMFSVADFVRAYLHLRGPAMVISTACSSSAKVFAVASRFIKAGFCDGAIVGGADSLCLTTVFGFSALDLMSTGVCRPCDENRDGLTLGEAAGFALVEAADRAVKSSAVALIGYGESTDGYHMSHPHPDGIGAIKAMQAALARAQVKPGDIDYINLHGTATRVNDLAEDKAVNALFGDTVPCSSTKGWTGHALGAAGIVETVISALCLTGGLVPGSLNTRRVDPALRCRVVLENEFRPIKRVLTNFFGFGGNNCSLVLEKL